MDIRCSPKLWISAWHLTVPQTLPDTHFAIHWSPSLLVHFCIVSLSVPYSDSKEQRDVQKQPGQVRKLISPLVIQGGHEIWREDCEVSHWTILFFFFWPRLTACRISVSWPGIEPGPWQWKPRIPTTRPPGNSHTELFLFLLYYGHSVTCSPTCFSSLYLQSTLPYA